MTIMLSTATVNPMPTAGAVIGKLSMFQNGAVVSGATFTLDDTNFLVIQGNVLTIAQPLPANVVPVKVYAVVNGAIVDEAQFQIVVLAISPDKSLITAPAGSLVGLAGVWTWGPQVSGSGGTIYQIYLNGIQAAGGVGSQLLIDNSGTTYRLYGTTWYQYVPATSTAAATWKNLNTPVQP